MIRIDPHHLGPLTAEPVMPGGPDELFPGAGAYLSARQQAKARALRDLVGDRVAALLEPGETVLYLARAHQVPSLFDQMGFGAYVYAYHTVALVLTDRRVLELLLEYGGKKLSTRTRSFAWGEAKSVTIGWRGLVLTSRAGKKHRWKVPTRGDRKALALLLPRVTERLLGVPALSTAPWPAWHCPECRATVEPKAAGCDACGVTFKSRRTATWLAIAFPGGGLYYAGHRVLGTMDLLGELFAFFVVATMAAEATSGADMAAAIGFGLFLFVLTKGESIHLSRILVHRTKPVTDSAAAGWRRLAVGGALASLLAVVAVPAVRGLAANPIDHDLVFSDASWTGHFDRTTWHRLADEPLGRSEWVHEEGWSLNVVAEPLGRGQSFDDFARDIDARRRAAGQAPAVRLRLGQLDALRAHQSFRSDDGVEAVSLRYFVYDPDGRDSHLVFWNVYADGHEEAQAVLEGLIATGSFGRPQAMPPIREVATAQ